MHTIIRTTESNKNVCVSRSVRTMARIAALTLVFTAASTGLQAQSDAAPAPHLDLLDLHAALSTPPNSPDSDAAASSFSSSSSSSPGTVAGERFNLSADAIQPPPPRRSYGHPRDLNEVKKYTFIVGGGFTVPTGTTSDTFTTSYKFQVGVGRNFNKKFAVLAQFDWDNFGVKGSVLNNLLVIYSNLCNLGCTGLPINQIGANAHDWSFSLNPVYNVVQSETLGAYVVGGVGFYHKNTEFTTPTIGQYCDYYYGCFTYAANSPIDEYTSNAAGINGGAGVTYRLSRWANERVYAEVRYVYTFNSPRPFSITGTTASPYYFNAFPQNSQKTSYLPITFGIRF